MREREVAAARAEAVERELTSARAVLADQEDSLTGRREALDALERDLAAREDALAQAQERVDRALGRGEEGLDRRRHEIAAHDATLTQREQALTEDASSEGRDPTEVQERRRSAALDVSVAAPATGAPAAGAGSTPPSASPPYDLFALASLVDERAPEFPDRLDEWQAYLFHLREFADVTGVLPSSFDGLVAGVFADLFESSAGAAEAR